MREVKWEVRWKLLIEVALCLGWYAVMKGWWPLEVWRLGKVRILGIACLLLV